MAITTFNPYTRKVLQEYGAESEESIKTKIAGIRDHQKKWAKIGIDERILSIKEFQKRVRQNEKQLVEMIASEMGKPVSQNHDEIKRSLTLLDYAIANFKKYLDEESVDTDALRSYTRYDPLGVVLGIEPWNVPLWQALKPSVPALLAGNGFVLKHSSIVSGTSKLIEELYDLPVFRSTITRGETALSSIKHVDAVAFTGSTETGSKIGEMAGKHIKKSVLELGGSDPFIVLESANVEEAARQAARGRLLNAGQRCVASKRFIVSDKVFDDFHEHMSEEFYKVVAGDPQDDRTFLGPMSSEEAFNKVSGQISELRALGKVERAFGEDLDPLFIPPTIALPSKSYGKEIFGPVAILEPFSSTDEAISIANNTEYGLGATVWGEPEDAEKLVPLLQAGSVFVNKTIASDPRIPFGGVKKSGFGREHGYHGVREFTNIKGVWIGRRD